VDDLETLEFLFVTEEFLLIFAFLVVELEVWRVDLTTLFVELAPGKEDLDD
jgi:hypothetical protein